MVYKKFRFTSERASRIQALVQQARPGTNHINTVNRNYYSTISNNSSIHQRILGEIMKPAVNNMPPALRDAVRRETTGIRVMVRKRYEGEGYARMQRMHIDIIRKPDVGEAYLQIIYYVNTPKMIKGSRIVNAPADLSGRLLLAPISGVKPVTIVTPKRGVGVYFTPNDTLHEVLPRKYKSNPNIKVSRDMVIMFLFKKTERSPINAAIPASNNTRKLGYKRVGLPSPNKMGGITPPSTRKSMYSKISTILTMRGTVANKARAANELLRTARTTRRTVPALERLKKRTALKPTRSPRRSPMNVN